jgi:hypothetical protein
MIEPISQVMYLDEEALLPAQPAPGRGRRRWQGRAFAAGLALVVQAAAAQAQDPVDRRLQQRLEEATRREAEALIALVDRAAAGEAVPSDFVMSWHHDFLKAQPGTFVPFVLTVERAETRPASGLLYVRAVRRREPTGPVEASESRTPGGRYAFDAVFPVELAASPGEPVLISRGFAVAPGEYDVYVALRERPDNLLEPDRNAALKAGVLRRSLSVPDFWNGQLSTSSVMLARRIVALPRPLGAEEALERPYVIGLNDVLVAPDPTFRRDRELIVVFVIYNPTVDRNGQFDIRVDYEVFRGARGTEGEQYVTRTNPQRFSPGTLGAPADPDAGHPVMAGQGILLHSFEAGEYRLGIGVTDLLSGQKLTREVRFRVVEGR